jgi:hypothetical protein
VYVVTELSPGGKLQLEAVLVSDWLEHRVVVKRAGKTALAEVTAVDSKQGLHDWRVKDLRWEGQYTRWPALVKHTWDMPPTHLLLLVQGRQHWWPPFTSSASLV